MGQRRTAIYCRISEDKVGAGLGVARQEADCRELADKLGWQVVRVYTDNDISAYSGKPRPGYRAMLADLEAGRVDAVVAWHPDRLHRRPVELEAFIDVCERGRVLVSTVRAGAVDLATPSGKMVARMLGAAARHEVEHGIERARRKRAQMAQDGAYRGGVRPFGYERDGVTVREAEAGELRDAAARVLAGQPVGAVAADWNARGVATSKGKGWTGPSVRRVLVRGRNAALIEHNGAAVGPASWPAILDDATFAGVRAALNDGHPVRRNAPRAERLLSGIARCGVDGCGAHLIGSGSSEAGTHRYRCSASRHLKRQADDLDAYVTGWVVDHLSRPESLDLIAPPADTGELHRRASAARARLDGLAEMFAAEEIDRAQLRAGSERIRRELAEVEAELAALAAGTALDGIAGHPDAAERWEALPIERRRAIVDATVTVSVLPARRGGTGKFNSEYVDVELRASQR